MKVRMIGCTKPINIIGIDDIQDLVAYCARVSNPTNQMNTETTDKLLKYLIAHKHWSVFEMASITMEIETTRDIARQMLRHRSFSFQEFSQRYKEVDAMGESFVVREARMQHPTNRQDSVACLDEEIQKAWIVKQQQLIHEARMAYHWALSKGIAKEQARVVLPEGNTVSRLYMQGSIRSWIHYVELRSGNGTQKEHMEIAVEIGKAIAEIFPMMEDIIDK